MLSSVSPLSSTLTSSPLLKKPQPHLFPIHKRPLFSKSQICFAIPPSNENPFGEEARWIREENRWLREEERWLREESRWNAERQALLLEINSLKLRIQELERFNSVQGASVSETVANIAKLIQVLKEGDLGKNELGKNVNRIAESGSSAVPLDVEAAKDEEEEEEVVVKEVISLPHKKETVQKRVTLRIGAEGDGVQAMQEALQKLGFYSGEEDIEFSTFSSGTESAVKTWQATLGVPEDGIMTAELLQLLFGSPGSGVPPSPEPKAAGSMKSGNGAPVSSITNISAVQQKVVPEEGVKKEVWSSENRVFLLGENRWEDSSRLSASKRPITPGGNGNVTTKCVTCRGEGRLLCMECDGTGEPNIEEQFMEWVDEGAKCPYCEGHGFTPCDLCGGRK